MADQAGGPIIEVTVFGDSVECSNMAEKPVPAIKPEAQLMTG
jgi:hypothetical protein